MVSFWTLSPWLLHCMLGERTSAVSGVCWGFAPWVAFMGTGGAMKMTKLPRSHYDMIACWIRIVKGHTPKAQRSNAKTLWTSHKSSPNHALKPLPKHPQESPELRASLKAWLGLRRPQPEATEAAQAEGRSLVGGHGAQLRRAGGDSL